MNKCSQCGTCCKLFWINLNETEYRSKKYKTMFEQFGFEKNFKDAERDGANILAQHEDGSCIYFKDNKCSIHEDRPKSCRNFFCDSNEKQFKGMIKKINESKKQDMTTLK